MGHADLGRPYHVIRVYTTNAGGGNRVNSGGHYIAKVGGIRNWLPYIINDELVIARQQILSPYF